MRSFRLRYALVALAAVCAIAGWWSVERNTAHTAARPRDSIADGNSSLHHAPAAVPKTLPLPRDSATSMHPVECAIAEGVVLESRLEPGASPGAWKRLRLVQTKVQPRPVRVVEEWKQTPGTGAWVCGRRDMYLADQLIITARKGISTGQLTQQLASLGMKLDGPVKDGVFTVRLPKAELEAAPGGLRLLAAHPEIVAAAEEDGVGFGGSIPNDSLFGQQWGLRNTGQSGGTAGADVDAPDFWDRIDSTPGMVIAVLDSGLNLTHPDLQDIAWVNPGEIAGDSIDNDGSGKVDDVNGWDFVNNDNDPSDDHGHGSNVTGIIAASRNNTEGIAGMIGGVRVVVCKILNSSNSGLTSNLIAATTYARLRGVPIMNLSLQSYPYSSTLDAEFTACQNAGILLCICAGNQGVNNDTTPNYPSSYPHANIIAVGSHDRTDARWSGTSNPSNYGAGNVDLFAPGREILSPILGTSYSNYTGTSQATPFVTAVATALKYLHPAWHAPEIKNRILGTVTVLPAYSGLCVTGGRLNAAAAVARASQTISFGALANRAFGDLPFTVGATASSGLQPDYSIVSGPATISGGTVTITGVGSVVVRASQAGDIDNYPAPDVDQAFTVAANFLWWRQTKFTVGELAGTGVSGPNAVYGNDGLTNLLKYALGFEPKSDIFTALPVVTATAIDWVYTYSRPSSISDVTYSVEISTDATTWTTAGVTHELVSSSGGVETRRGRYPLASAANIYFRLKVVRP